LLVYTSRRPSHNLCGSRRAFRARSPKKLPTSEATKAPSGCFSRNSRIHSGYQAREINTPCVRITVFRQRRVPADWPESVPIPDRGDFSTTRVRAFSQSAPTLTKKWQSGKAASRTLSRFIPSTNSRNLIGKRRKPVNCRFLAVVNRFCSSTQNKVSADSSELYTCTMVQSLLMRFASYETINHM
jgi:hypothetical protein